MTMTYEALAATSEYQALIRKRNRIIWPLAVFTVVIYMAFILAIAFDPQALGSKLSDGSIVSVGIVLGIGLILLNFVITLVYVFRANRELQPLIERIQTIAEKQ